MASPQPHDDWVVNRHFTSRCDFCDTKNTVLQHCDAPGCHINVCEYCMRTGVLAEDEKHQVGRHEADCFEWQRKILPREGGTTARLPSQQAGVPVIAHAPKPAEARGASSTIPTPHLAKPGTYRPDPVYGTLGPHPFPALPLPFPSGPMYMGQTYPVVAMPTFRPSYAYATPDASGGLPGLVACAGEVQAHKEPEVEPKTGPKHARKNPRRQAEAKGPAKTSKRQRRSEVATKNAASAVSNAQAADQDLDVSEEVIEAANILVAMSRGGYATDPLATPPHTAGERGPVTTPEAIEQPSFLPVSIPAFFYFYFFLSFHWTPLVCLDVPATDANHLTSQTPAPSASGPKSSKSKGKQSSKKTTPTAAQEDVPWNPLEQRFPITRAQWNEREREREPAAAAKNKNKNNNKKRGQQKEATRGGRLSARAQGLRDAWGRVTSTVRRQFGLDDDEAAFPGDEAAQFRLAWERMEECKPDESAENRLNRAIAIAVAVEVGTVMAEALGEWEGE